MDKLKRVGVKRRVAAATTHKMLRNKLELGWKCGVPNDAGPRWLNNQRVERRALLIDNHKFCV